MNSKKYDDYLIKNNFKNYITKIGSQKWISQIVTDYRKYMFFLCIFNINIYLVISQSLLRVLLWFNRFFYFFVITIKSFPSLKYILVNALNANLEAGLLQFPAFVDVILSMSTFPRFINLEPFLQMLVHLFMSIVHRDNHNLSHSNSLLLSNNIMLPFSSPKPINNPSIIKETFNNIRLVEVLWRGNHQWGIAREG